MHSGLVALEDRGKARLYKGNSANVKAEPVLWNNHIFGLERLDLPASREDCGVHVAAVGKVPQGLGVRLFRVKVFLDV